MSKRKSTYIRAGGSRLQSHCLLSWRTPSWALDKCSLSTPSFSLKTINPWDSIHHIFWTKPQSKTASFEEEMNHQTIWWYLFFTDCQNAFVAALYLQTQIIVGEEKNNTTWLIILSQQTSDKKQNDDEPCRAVISSTKPMPMPVTICVPQRSRLGPILFCHLC